jgi:Protein of unknown function (DUF1501)
MSTTTPSAPVHSPYSRREFLRLGALAWGGFSLPELLRLQASAASKNGGRCRAVIQIYLGGGPSHLDMYDLKPHAPLEIRGEFQPIATSLEGVSLSEHLPFQAKLLDKMAVIRSGTHGISSHLPGSHLMLTGHAQINPSAQNHNPSCGSVVARLRGSNEPGLPAYVAVPRKNAYGSAAYLGGACEPFTTDLEPNSKDFRVRSLKLEGGLSVDRLQTRQSLLQQFDQFRRDLDLNGNLSGMDSFSQQAMQLVTSERAARAFQIGDEPVAVRERYGWTNLGQNCLLARRLVEAGVTYVTCLSGGGWDTHVNNFTELRTVSLPRYDQAVAALVGDLCERGLDKDVLVMAFGEFGRTPKINKDAGRDHWPSAMSVLFAGGGLRMGQIVGATDAHGANPISSPASPGSILATMYHALGIDYRHEFRDLSGRMIPVVPEGRPIAELV